MQLDLKGRVALVTGSDRNTGAVIARGMEGSGAQVIVHSNEPGDSAANAAAEAHCEYWVEGDIGTEEGCEAVLAQLGERAPAVDILVNNYGTAAFATWDSASTGDWIDMYQKPCAPVIER